MKKILIIPLLAVLIHFTQAQFYFRDTVEAGSSDSIYTPQLEKVPAYISLTIIGLDTNATFPDSVIVELIGIHGYQGTLGFHKSATDSTLDVIVVKYGTGVAKHYLNYITGWVWQPYIAGIRFRLFNQYYLSNRRILVIGEYK